MSMPLADRQRAALSELLKLVEETHVSGTQAVEAHTSAQESASRDIQRARKKVTGERTVELSAVEEAYVSRLQEIDSRAATERKQLVADYFESRERINEKYDAAEAKAKSEWQDANWAADSISEASEKQAQDELLALHRKAEASRTRAEALRAEPEPLRVRFDLEQAEPLPLGMPMSDDPQSDLRQAFAKADARITAMHDVPGMRWVTAKGFTPIVLGEILLFAILPWLLTQSPLAWILGLMATAAVSVLLHALILRRVRDRLYKLDGELVWATRAAEAAADRLDKWAAKQHNEKLREIAAIKHKAYVAAEMKYQPLLNTLAERRQNDLAEAKAHHQRATDELEAAVVEDRRIAKVDLEQKQHEINARHDQAMGEVENEVHRKIRQAEITRNRVQAENEQRWTTTLASLRSDLAIMSAVAAKTFPDWSLLRDADRPAPKTIPPGIPFGSIKFDLADIPNGVSAAGKALTEPLAVEKLPAFLPFPARANLLLRVKDNSRPRAVELMQAIMLRFLTGLPPGKVRFTVVDPVGLGENFASFMHLADYDENLIGARIWTEPEQIERRLADLTQHMETVIQKYLRNQYRSIEEYNRLAGEVAEPFRVLVVANFPNNFTPEAARRLVSIVSSGAICGIYTLISVDTKAPLPQGFALSDIEGPSLTLAANDLGQFKWQDDVMARFPLRTETPPDAATTAAIIHLVGDRARDANRVEVPFEFVAPSEDRVWKSDSRYGITVPIGRAGATRKQALALGKGTAQHALVAGKTGSGKSSLLHALITNIALMYAPDEVELYLVDFKKGVEFKAYATNCLPHAKVIAIESEREFGLSVLQRLDGILRERGDKFRAAGTNDVASYRAARPNEVLPRILLIVDEFQEFFVEDDRLSQEAGLLLDRLVRQGRAFGLHVLLGSQTLGGAYSLARTTIDQMAVRIALQCSDADAQLILSKDNTAARLLSRPGEAIYNDANGLVEGNDPFQVVWLSDAEREKYLKIVAKQVGSREIAPPLVFEGNAAADLEKNPAYAALRAGRPTTYKSGSALPAWLGEAIAIKEPTTALFRPLSGSHLLMIGQHDEGARQIIASSALGISMSAPDVSRFYLLDGSPEEDPLSGYLRGYLSTLKAEVKLIERNDLLAALSEVAGSVAARQKGEAERTPTFVFINGLHRFRDLRKGEDDFGYRRGEKVLSAADHFQTIIKEGASQGVHLVCWVDGVTNLSRFIDRQGLREFAMRILFQMSAADSSQLIDAPTASRLGRYRALFAQDDQPTPEKFRPYALQR